MAKLSPLLKQATPVVVDHGEGAYLYDTDGRRHLDFTAGIGVTSTGHCHPRVVAAAQEQIGKLVHGQYTTVMHKPLLPNVVVFQGGFHGRTVATATMTTSGTRFSAGISPLMGGVHVAPFPFAYHYGWDERTATEFALRELDYLFATVTAPNETAAFIIEPMLGEGGYVPANSEFMAGLRRRADEHGILLVIDEIQTGFGRTGRFWGHDHFDVRPDVMTIAKGLASGFPLSGIAASEELMAKAFPGSQGGTYGGNAVSCAAAVATLDVINDENLVENAAARGKQLLDGARAVADKTSAIGDVRGLGLLVGSEFTAADGTPDNATAQAAQKLAAERGLLMLTCGAYMNVVRMIPPLVVTAEQIDEALEIWSGVVADVTA
ncbi:4-aminobutyrate aminotransferase [Streptomyces regensis]|nr:4-aminobutyrate aminotransferase [Streptomyces regensis]